MQTKREREKQLVSQMIALYCKKHHGGKDFSPPMRRPWIGMPGSAVTDAPLWRRKTFCSNCKVHCYRPEMRESIRAVMVFGPRMIFHHPL